MSDDIVVLAKWQEESESRSLSYLEYFALWRTRSLKIQHFING